MLLFVVSSLKYHVRTARLRAVSNVRARRRHYILLLSLWLCFFSSHLSPPLRWALWLTQSLIMCEYYYIIAKKSQFSVWPYYHSHILGPINKSLLNWSPNRHHPVAIAHEKQLQPQTTDQTCTLINSKYNKTEAAKITAFQSRQKTCFFNRKTTQKLHNFSRFELFFDQRKLNKYSIMDYSVVIPVRLSICAFDPVDFESRISKSRNFSKLVKILVNLPVK